MATLEVFTPISGDFTDTFKEVMRLSLGTNALKGLAVYLNLPTDLTGSASIAIVVK